LLSGIKSIKLICFVIAAARRQRCDPHEKLLRQTPVNCIYLFWSIMARSKSKQRRVRMERRQQRKARSKRQKAARKLQTVKA